MPYTVSPTIKLAELTLRGCILGVLITVMFTAANIYLGLKVGLTFSSAIPAAVISMALLKFFKDSNILENTMVQTFASAAGTLSAVIFALPALILVGFWQEFPFWQTSLICALGGILGVLYSIPLRRALVVQGDLPYPEGSAAAEVLSVSSQNKANLSAVGASTGLKDIILGGALSSIFALVSHGFKVFSDSIAIFYRVGTLPLGVGFAFSLALLGAGYIVGIQIGLALLLGIIISWGVAIPLFSLGQVAPVGSTVAEYATTIWSQEVRIMGVGTIAIAAIWAVIVLLKPLVQGVRSAFATLAQLRAGDSRKILRTEKDIPINLVITGIILMLIPLAALLGSFIANGIQFNTWLLLIFMGVLFIVIFGFITASVSGYMAGLIGSSNSPISGIGVLALILSALLVLAIVGIDFVPQFHTLSLAIPIFITAVVIAVAAISNDNLQDLKTGQLVGATPWKQQTALILGVIVGAIVIPPILQLMYQAYGFPGFLPRAGMDAADALSAPQAVLMSTLVQGIMTQSLNWNRLLMGVGIGASLLLFDGLCLKRKGWPRLSVLAVGMAMYLPPEVVMTLIGGGVLSWLTSRHLSPRKAKQVGENAHHLQTIIRRGVLIASGLIVGESLLGVVLAFLIITTGNSSPLALVTAQFEPMATFLGALGFFSICVLIYYYIKTSGRFTTRDNYS